MEDLSASALVAEHLEVRESSSSTNSELIEFAAKSPAEWPDFSVLATLDQRSGKGRLGRSWISWPGQALAASVLLRVSGLERWNSAAYGWLSLLAGTAMCRAVSTLVRSHRVTVKWPNDVLIDGRKVCGILGELTESGDVVLGAGINLSQSAEQFAEAGLDPELVTSLAQADAATTRADEVLLRYLAAFRSEYDALVASGGDAVASGLHARAVTLCSTIGSDVTVAGFNGDIVNGRATGIDALGRLEVLTADGTSAFTAGDVTHVRPQAR